MSIKDLILDFEFEKAEKELNESNSADKAHMNQGIIAVIRTLITRSESDYNNTMGLLESIQRAANQEFLSKTIQLYPKADMFTIKTLQLLDDDRFIKPGDDFEFFQAYSQRLMAELITVKCSMLSLFLKCMFTGEYSNIFSSLLAESELKDFRESFMTLYHAYERSKLLPKENVLMMGSSEYRIELDLAWGISSLITILLPSQLSIIMGISRFQPTSISDALNLIDSITTGPEVHNLLATLILIIYYMEIKSDPEMVQKYLTILKQPKSAMYQYFQAKLLRLKGQSSAVIEIFSKIRLVPSVIQFPVYWQMIQCFAENQKWPEAVQYIRSLRDCSGAGGYPSKIFSFYLEAAFIQAASGRAFGPFSSEVQVLLEKILEVARTRHKAPRPLLDRLAITRARNVLERNEHFFLPHFEILLLWDRLKEIDHKDFVMSQVRKALESSGQLTFEQQMLGWLILAVLSDTPAVSSNLITNHILPREKYLSATSFTFIRAKCELANSLLLEGNVEVGRKLLNEIEMKCFDKNGFPGQTTILLLLSKMKQKIE